MKWAILLLTIGFFACKSRGPACYIDATDIVKGAHKKMITVKDSGYKITALYDDGWDSLKGGAYLFYPNEFLKSYTFYQHGNPVYSETYDEHGYVTKTTGSPMVSRVITEYGDDSAYVEVQFYGLLKTYRQLNIKVNNHGVNLDLVADSLFSNIKSAIYGFNTVDLNAVNMYTNIVYTEDCNKVEHVLSDSLFLVKDSRNGLAPATSK